MDDFRPKGVRSGIGGSEFGATVVGEASGAREESDFVPGGTSLGGASGNETLAVEGASGGEMDDFRPEEVRFGRGGSEFGPQWLEGRLRAKRAIWPHNLKR